MVYTVYNVYVYDKTDTFLFKRGSFSTREKAQTFSNEPHFRYWLSEYGCYTIIRPELRFFNLDVNNMLY